MTAHQFNRARRWDRRLQRSYSAGVMDGFDMRLAGLPRPEPLLSDYNLKFYVRTHMRHAQEVTNAAIARSRGKADGWDSADREVIEAEVAEQMESVIAGFENLLRAA